MFSQPTANNLICTEPSPKTPTEKFFESEIASSTGRPNDEPAVSSDGSSSSAPGSSGSSDSNGSAATDCTSSPTLSDASSGYESLLDDSSQPDHSGVLLNVVLSESHLESAQHQQQQLLPAEEIYYTVAPRDSQILDDFRVTRQMLLIEDRYVPWGVVEQVYRCRKYDTDEKARSIVTGWMYEVCEVLKCEEVTFSLAVNYLDRFLLATPELRKVQLQLVAIVCLLIASKLRQCVTLDPKELSYMSANSVTVTEILSWEPLVLKRLNWDVSSVIAIDYLDHILVKLPELCQASITGQPTTTTSTSQHSNISVLSSSPLRSSNILSQTSSTLSSPSSSSSSSSAISSPRSAKRPFWTMAMSFSASSSPPPPSTLSPQQKRFRASAEHSCKKSRSQPQSCADLQCWPLPSSASNLHDTVRRHASTLISLCAIELEFACVRPSVIAAACVATAVRGILQRAQCSHSIASTFAFFSAQLQIDIDSKSIRYYMNQVERVLAKELAKLSKSSSNSSKHQLVNNTSAVDAKAKSSPKLSAAGVKHHFQASQHRTHPLEQHYHHHQQQQHSFHPYHSYQPSAPVHHYHHSSPMHSTNGHSPNASCIGGSAAASAAAAAAAASATTTTTSMHSPSRFSPIAFHHCNVPTAQVISAKMLLLEQQQQRSPPNRAYHLRQQHQHIPEASHFLARCSQPSVGQTHLHDSSNTSTFSSSSSSSGNDDIFKSKLINFNYLSESVNSFSTTTNSTTHLLSPSVDEQYDDEDRENMAPTSTVALAGEGNSLDSLLLSTEDFSELSDDEDGNFPEFY